MLEHVYRRASEYGHWDVLAVSTCDDVIREFAESKQMPVIMTSSKHARALDRVAEAITLLDMDVDDDDIVLNVQGDEPMMQPEMIDAAIRPMREDGEVKGTVLGLPIIDENQFRDPNVLKIIRNLKNDILYTSRSPIPHCETFTKDMDVYRIYGIFGFRWHFLKLFTELAESPLELNEACDSNRLYDYGYTQRLAPFPYVDSFAVDVPSDIALVEKHLSALVS